MESKLLSPEREHSFAADLKQVCEKNKLEFSLCCADSTWFVSFTTEFEAEFKFRDKDFMHAVSIAYSSWYSTAKKPIYVRAHTPHEIVGEVHKRLNRLKRMFPPTPVPVYDSVQTASSYARRMGFEVTTQPEVG